jgi:hypothetical protein
MVYGYRKKIPPKSKLEYKKYRVRGNIRSFRDLEIYKKTTELSSIIFKTELPKNLKGRAKIQEELNILYAIAKHIPKLIAEAYGERFVNKQRAYTTLEKAMRCVDKTITKLDFLIAAIDTHKIKAEFVALINEYQKQKLKTLNLKRAWERFEKRKDTYAQKT